MMHQVKIFTHESIVHYQVDSINKLLHYERPLEITLNVKARKSNICFLATLEEVQSIRNDLQLKVYVKNTFDDGWSEM